MHIDSIERLPRALSRAQRARGQEAARGSTCTAGASWQASAEVGRPVLPTMGQMINSQTGIEAPAEPQEAMLALHRRLARGRGPRILVRAKDRGP